MKYRKEDYTNNNNSSLKSSIPDAADEATYLLRGQSIRSKTSN